MKKIVRQKKVKEQNGKSVCLKVWFCELCMRVLPKGVYRLNDVFCPPLRDGIPDTRTCLEDCMLQNQVISKAYLEIAEKKRLEEGKDSKDAKYFEKQAKALLNCGKAGKRRF
jgi:hypothetical protein